MSKKSKWAITEQGLGEAETEGTNWEGEKSFSQKSKRGVDKKLETEMHIRRLWKAEMHLSGSEIIDKNL